MQESDSKGTPGETKARFLWDARDCSFWLLTRRLEPGPGAVVNLVRGFRFTTSS